MARTRPIRTRLPDCCYPGYRRALVYFRHGTLPARAPLAEFEAGSFPNGYCR